jgi:hypothetical protein
VLRAVLRATDTVYALVCEVNAHSVGALRQRNQFAKQATKKQKQKAAALAFAGMQRSLQARERREFEKVTSTTEHARSESAVAYGDGCDSYVVSAASTPTGASPLTPWLADFGELQFESRIAGGPPMQTYLVTAEHLKEMWTKPLEVLGELHWTDIFPPHQFGIDTDPAVDGTGACTLSFVYFCALGAQFHMLVATLPA